MAKSKNPLACPFCGKDTVKVKNVGVELGDPEYAVRCETCWFDGPTDWDKEKAVAQWNARAGAPEPTNNGRSAVALHALGRAAAESDNCEWCRREVKRGELTPIYDLAPTGERDWVCASCLAGSSSTEKAEPQKPTRRTNE